MVLLGEINFMIFVGKACNMNYLEKLNRRTSRCLECGDLITYGRVDKKFCSDVCRNKYRYYHHRNGVRVRRKIMAGLEKNHKILCSMIENEVLSLPITAAVLEGFNSELYTSVKKSGCHVEYLCFDVVYRVTKTRLSIISRF